MATIPYQREHLSRWKAYLSDIGVRDDLKVIYLYHVKKSLEKGVPPIFEHEQLALLLGIEVAHLMRMLFGQQSFYREFSLRKRSGGYRTIRAPLPTLLECQRWINSNILSAVQLAQPAMGFREEHSILDNARIHCGREELYKIDLKDFFPSIGFRRVMGAFISLNYPKHVAFFLSRICTVDDELPQGAATSPALSNIICNRLDMRLRAICRKRNLRYTRYADDITISGKRITDELKWIAHKIVEDEGFIINREKIRHVFAGEKKIVTGLDITSGVVRIPRHYRREVMKDVYFVWSSGLSNHMAKNRAFEPNYMAQLAGRLQFWKHVEPQNPQMLKCLKRFESVMLLYQN
ncbi:reverse transcriptase family protein [Agrobacterium leguminum]